MNGRPANGTQTTGNEKGAINSHSGQRESQTSSETLTIQIPGVRGCDKASHGINFRASKKEYHFQKYSFRLL